VKRLRRILLNALTALSLILLAATVALWVRSYWQAQYLGWSDGSQFYGGLSVAGLLRLEHGTYGDSSPGFSYVTYPHKGRSGLWSELGARDRRGGPLKRIGFGSSKIDYDLDGKKMRYSLYLSHWSLAALLVIAPAIRSRQILRRRRAAALTRRQRCVVCGYDLRATPDRCPECGTVPAR
jgi:hypothetical protein